MRKKKTSGKSPTVRGNGYRSVRSRAVKKTAQRLGTRAQIRGNAKRRVKEKEK